jgi:hypothetical protein
VYTGTVVDDNKDLSKIFIIVHFSREVEDNLSHRVLCSELSSPSGLLSGRASIRDSRAKETEGLAGSPESWARGSVQRKIILAFIWSNYSA